MCFQVRRADLPLGPADDCVCRVFGVNLTPDKYATCGASARNTGKSSCKKVSGRTGDLQSIKLTAAAVLASSSSALGGQVQRSCSNLCVKPALLRDRWEGGFLQASQFIHWVVSESYNSLWMQQKKKKHWLLATTIYYPKKMLFFFWNFCIQSRIISLIYVHACNTWVKPALFVRKSDSLKRIRIPMAEKSRWSKFARPATLLHLTGLLPPGHLASPLAVFTNMWKLCRWVINNAALFNLWSASTFRLFFLLTGSNTESWMGVRRLDSGSKIKS